MVKLDMSSLKWSVARAEMLMDEPLNVQQTMYSPIFMHTVSDISTHEYLRFDGYHVLPS